jgi:hypothetical protein
MKSSNPMSEGFAIQRLTADAALATAEMQPNRRFNYTIGGALRPVWLEFNAMRHHLSALTALLIFLCKEGSRRNM